MNSGKLYLIPTVIADDTQKSVLSPQIVEVLSHLDYFLVENLRTARRFIGSLKLGLVIDQLTFEELNKDTQQAEVERMMKPVLEGKSAGIISEAGCPGIADPGSLAVQWAHKKGIQVVPLVGPSSIFLALMASGMNGQQFAFHGYLPIDAKERITAIKNLELESKKKNQAQIFMETPYRNNKFLADLLVHLSANTRLCIAKSITGTDESIITKNINDWKNNIPDLDKVPVVFVLQS
jgi:16S rRNA (cytidine1402-2'-O)-methyltransferase